jgi:transposase
MWPLRQERNGGEKLFVDWAGTTIPIHDPRGGPVQQAHPFVAVLGASSYTYAEATADERLASWIGAHVRASSSIPTVLQSGADFSACAPVSTGAVAGRNEVLRGLKPAPQSFRAGVLVCRAGVAKAEIAHLASRRAFAYLTSK